MNVTKEIVTPKKAMEWLKRNVANRPLGVKRVGFYARTMTDGAWKLNGDTIRFNGNGDLIDGQHRLSACVKADVSFETYVVRGLEHDAFDTIDQGKSRSIGDVFARQGHKHYIKLASAARWLWMRDNNCMPRGSEKLTFRADHANEIIAKYPTLHHCVALASGLRNNLLNPGVLGFLFFQSIESCGEDVAVAFWNRTLLADGLKRGTPEYLLHSRLVSNLTSVAKLNSDTIVAITIKTWNAHKTGKNQGVLRWSNNEPFPVML